jgi:hypothetical protein
MFSDTCGRQSNLNVIEALFGEFEFLQLVEDIALDIFAPNLFVRAALLVMTLVLAALHEL